VAASGAVHVDLVETAIANATTDTRSLTFVFILSQMGGANHLAHFFAIFLP